VWDAASGSCTLTVSFASQVHRLTVLKDGHLAVGLGNGYIYVLE
jgi:hypothetical protein